MPNMVDPYFAKSVIFICEDDTNGTMGIIVNKPISQMKIVSSGIKNKIFEDIINDIPELNNCFKDYIVKHNPGYQK